MDLKHPDNWFVLVEKEWKLLFKALRKAGFFVDIGRCTGNIWSKRPVTDDARKLTWMSKDFLGQWIIESLDEKFFHHLKKAVGAMRINRQNAETARFFEHVDIKNKSDGTPARARRNGKTQTWKTRPDDFKIPVKHGLRDCFYITPENAHEWRIADS